MKIIIKFILKNIREKKFRTFLILFSIALSSALFYASIALSGTLENIILERIKKYIGTADIVIYPNEKSPTWHYSLYNLQKYANRLDYAVGSMELRGTYKNTKESLELDLKGFNLNDLQKMNPFILKTNWHMDPFIGNKIVLSLKTAKQYHFQPGDNIELKINEQRFRFRIVGIAQPVGMFQEDGRSNTALVPLSTVSRLLGAPGRITIAYLKVKDPSQIPETVELLSKEYRRFTVREPFSKAELKDNLEAFTIPFQIMVVLVLFISVFIIYSSFKVITRERLPIIGTFRSIGATRKMTDCVLFGESLFYGFVGGILGCLLGMGILKIMTRLITPESLANVRSVSPYNIFHFVGAFLLALFLPLISSLFPIIKISKIPVKEIILNNIEKTRRRKATRWIAGLISLMVAVSAPWISPKAIALAVNIICIHLAVAGAILLVPYITTGFLRFFESVYTYLLGSEGILAAKNLRENKSILNNISLLTIGISSLLMINTVSFSAAEEVANFYKDGTFDIWMGYQNANRHLEAVIRSIPGVSGVYGVYNANNIEIDGTTERIKLIHGINTQRHLEYWNMPFDGNAAQLLSQLDSGRNIILSSVLRDKLEVNTGELITFTMNDTKRTYRIIGFFHSMMDGGSYALVSAKYLKQDMRFHYYGNLFIKTSGDPAIVAETLKQKFKRNLPWIRTTAEMTADELKSQKQTFTLLQGFSIMTLIIGIFGIFNNLLISFIERKRPLAIMRSIGMSKNQALKMIFIESFTGGIIGGAMGILTGTIMIGLVPFLMRSINQVAPIHYSLREYLVAFSAGVIITVISSVSPAFKSFKMNIIEAIKYE